MSNAPAIPGAPEMASLPVEPLCAGCQRDPVRILDHDGAHITLSSRRP
ncbi:hypothetical protein M2157_009443 [Streptomyces sp. SAI-127]|nr:hypothetical protein [Streptomyces sp. SAI-127]